MADFFNCTNSGTAFTAFFMNLIESYTEAPGTTYGGWNTAIYTSATPSSPYVCTANDTLDSLLKRCIEESTCCFYDEANTMPVPLFRLYVVEPRDCTHHIPCGANPSLLFEGVKYTFVELAGVGLAMVIFDGRHLCNQPI
jgi:hypothetical protein